MPTEFAIYVHERSKKPRHVDTVATNAIPATWTHAGRTFHFVTADLSARTITFSDFAPTPVEGK